MSPTFATVFSGIGGADWGLQHAGWELRWQCEIDPWRREILEAHWPGLRRYHDAAEFPGEKPERVDLLHTFPPTSSPEWLEMFWPIVESVRPACVVLEAGQKCFEAAREWFLRLGYRGVAFTVTLEQRAGWLPLPLTRVSPFLVAWQGPGDSGLSAALGDAKLTVALRDGDTGPPRSIVEIIERIKGLPCGWSCVCGEADPWACGESSKRLVAVNEASVPDLARWIGERLLPLVARKEAQCRNG